MKAMWIVAAVALSFTTMACGGGTGACKSACGKAADCEEGDFLYTDDEDACKDDCDDQWEDAKDADCKSEYKDVASCYKSNFSCDGEDLTECADDFTAYQECAAE